MTIERADPLEAMPAWRALLAAGKVDPVDPAVLGRIVVSVKAAAVPADASAPVARSRYSRLQLRFAAGVVGIVSATIGIGILVVVGNEHRQGPGLVAASPGAALPNGSAASCVEGFGLETLRHRAFAFAGTVAAITPPAVDGEPFLVTFHDVEWFRGGGDHGVDVGMPAPQGGFHHDGTNENGATYAVGTELLVSGEFASEGRLKGRPIAWTCGFTRYYDAASASAWQAALRLTG
ncbi:hypothetical protein [Dactylosporangium sp. NPDC051484]|uniref:hypothetical protein n=1 Tax=Dactylosporangium sp. NPDC051484 TaxID=3154942 RepID=UPI0034508C63